MKPTLLALILCLTGCSTPKVWYRADTTPAQFQMDKAEARLRYQFLSLAQPNVSVNVAVANNGNAVAAGGRGYDLKAALGDAIERGRFVDDWLRAKGYQKTPITQVPTNWPALSGQL